MRTRSLYEAVIPSEACPGVVLHYWADSAEECVSRLQHDDDVWKRPFAIRKIHEVDASCGGLPRKGMVFNYRRK